MTFLSKTIIFSLMISSLISVSVSAKKQYCTKTENEKKILAFITEDDAAEIVKNYPWYQKLLVDTSDLKNHHQKMADEFRAPLDMYNLSCDYTVREFHFADSALVNQIMHSCLYSGVFIATHGSKGSNANAGVSSGNLYNVYGYQMLESIESTARNIKTLGVIGCSSSSLGNKLATQMSFTERLAQKDPVQIILFPTKVEAIKKMPESLPLSAKLLLPLLGISEAQIWDNLKTVRYQAIRSAIGRASAVLKENADDLTNYCNACERKQGWKVLIKRICEEDSPAVQIRTRLGMIAVMPACKKGEVVQTHGYIRKPNEQKVSSEISEERGENAVSANEIKIVVSSGLNAKGKVAKLGKFDFSSPANLTKDENKWKVLIDVDTMQPLGEYSFVYKFKGELPLKTATVVDYTDQYDCKAMEKVRSTWGK